jgi:catechol 2,3-dioxygenase-like lactoylglutathione lyase family enzyme
MWSVRARRRLSLHGHPRLGPLEHITIPVKDLVLARKFYCDELGATYLMTFDDEAFRRFGRPPAANHGEGAHFAEHTSAACCGRSSAFRL